uniref:Uncharacterized protein n=1 Tax=Cajanus cajan TaxID=3821 RepID=A0A151U0G0_CAJCA|nr:hypothetical protein KK1_005411 [Cajanus cajan]
MFEPRGLSSIEKRDSGADDNIFSAATATAPEKKLTLFALRLAVLEKAATSLGTLGFIWATVVLLGGFAITLDQTDFWFITIILLIEGTRIFSRSHEIVHELEWQHQATWSITDAGINSFRMLSKLLYWLQLFSATACVVLSSMKLIKHNYGEVAKGDTDRMNRESALNIFYALALAEALLFLMEKAYWEWKISYCKLLDEVNKECELGPSGMVSIRRFFYDAYSRCVNGSIFDGLKMDIVCFAMDLLASNSPDEQLIGARILRQFAVSERFSDDTLQKLGISISVVERLVEMLNWTDHKEEEIRLSAAEILSALAGKKQNSLRIAGIPGAMESISTLLQTNRNCIAAADEIGEKKLIFDHPDYGYWTFNHLGLLILKKVLQAIMSQENKLQEVMIGLAASVFTFMSSSESSTVFEESEITEAELANKLVQILKKHQYPPTKVPRIRRFVIELAIWMMKEREDNIHTFKDLGMEEVLEGILETTSELESFNVFSGTVGLNRHNLTIHSLVETGLKLLEDR